MAVDPAMPMDRAALRLVIGTSAAGAARYVYPWLRVVSRVAGHGDRGRASGPARCRFAAHATMDRLCLWFLRRFVSPDAVSLLIRHFIVETNLLNFCAAQRAARRRREVGLRPVTLAGLGDRAVIEHDLNVYRVLSRPRRCPAARPGRVAGSTSACSTFPPVDPEPWRRRLLHLDIQTALCLMNIPFALCLTSAEYRRAVHSLRLDASLLTRARVAHR